MMIRLRNYIRQQHLGLLALLLVLTGGTAYALEGSNTVFSDDIANGEVHAGDIEPAAVTSGKLAQGAVNSAKVGDQTLTGDDIADNSITGDDVNEALLGEVRSAALGGIGRWLGGNTCDPGINYFTCAFVSIDLPSVSRVLMIGVANARGGTDEHGSCRLATHLGDLPASTVPVIVDTGSLVNGAGRTVSLVAITGPLGPGAVDFAIRCAEQHGDIWFSHVQIAAIALSPN